MTESDLQSLVRRASLRMRLERALHWGLASAVLACAAAAASVFVLRWLGRESVPLSLFAAIPPVAALLGGILAFILTRISPTAAASALDRRAATQEHLVTWLHLRLQHDGDDDGLAAGFKRAQRESALRAAETVRLGQHAPIHFPAWSRALWLAMILFISAVLTPAADPHPAAPARMAVPGGAQTSPGESVSGDALRNSVAEISRVQVLAPAQLRKLELISTDSRLPDSLKADALKELQSAIGSVPESELSPEVRKLLDMLRQAVPAKKSPDVKGVQPGVNTTGETPSPAAPEPAAEYKAFESVERAWSSGETRFSDVKDSLRRYYGSTSNSGKNP